jgi:hypothetical protein
VTVTDRKRQAHWCHRLGATHQRRDESARHEECALLDRDAQRQIAVRRRWPAIAAAMRALASRYNDGAGGEVLTVVDNTDSESRAPILEVVAHGGRTLTLELSGADLCVRPNGGAAGEPDSGRRWLTFDLSDEDMAASALQPWLMRS